MLFPLSIFIGPRLTRNTLLTHSLFINLQDNWGAQIFRRLKMDNFITARSKTMPFLLFPAHSSCIQIKSVFGYTNILSTHLPWIRRITKNKRTSVCACVSHWFSISKKQWSFGLCWFRKLPDCGKGILTVFLTCFISDYLETKSF